MRVVAGLPIAVLAIVLAQAPRVSLTPIPPASGPGRRLRALPGLVRLVLALH